MFLRCQQPYLNKRKGRNNYTKILSRIENSILSIANFNEFLLCFTNKATYVKISSCIIHRWPDSSYNYHSLHWASSYIYDKIMNKLEQNRWNKLLQKIQSLFDPSNARGILFETYVLSLFKHDDCFETKCLEKNKNEVEQFPILGFDEYKYVLCSELGRAMGFKSWLI